MLLVFQEFESTIQIWTDLFSTVFRALNFRTRLGVVLTLNAVQAHISHVIIQTCRIYLILKILRYFHFVIELLVQ